MERLCFGTFVDVLMQCRTEKTNKTQFVGAIIRSIDPDNKYVIENQSLDKKQEILRALNHLYKCTGDFTPNYSSIVQLAPKAKRESVIDKFETDVISLIDKDKYALAVLTLCDLIQKDTTLVCKMGGQNSENEKKFQHYISKEIKDFVNNEEYVLSVFLVDIFLYCIIEIKNTVGQDWLKSISSNKKYCNYDKYFENYLNQFKEKKDTIKVWGTIEEKESDSTHSVTSQTKTNEIHTTLLEINEDSLDNLGNTLPPEFNGAHLSIPENCKRCLCCDSWEGNAQNAYKNKAGTFGKCLLYNKDMRSSDSCERFNPNYGRINTYEYHQKNATLIKLMPFKRED